MKSNKPKMHLSCNWFCHSPIDVEHKQYVLLDYLQKVKAGFKAKDLASYYQELQYHSKNIECFLAVRNMLDTRSISPSESEKKLFKEICSLPDTDEKLKAVIEIANWSHKKLQKTLKDGNELIRMIESNIIMYYIGKNFPLKNNGYLLIRYAGSHVFECFKFLYDTTYKETTFEFFNYFDLPTMSDFRDVKSKVLKLENKSDDIFIAVESHLSFDTKKSLLPVLNEIFPTKVFNNTIYGLPSF